MRDCEWKEIAELRTHPSRLLASLAFAFPPAQFDGKRLNIGCPYGRAAELKQLALQLI
jgi:hypothetical protein